MGWFEEGAFYSDSNPRSTASTAGKKETQEKEKSRRNERLSRGSMVKKIRKKDAHWGSQLQDGGQLGEGAKSKGKDRNLKLTSMEKISQLGVDIKNSGREGRTKNRAKCQGPRK